MLTEDRIINIRKSQQGRYGSSGTTPYADSIQFARAIESAACAERDKRIAELERKSDQDDETILWQAKEIADKIDRVAELERQLEEARKDAERYRWLRDTSNPDDSRHMIALHINDQQEDASLSGIDAAIDAAMQKGQS